MFRIRATLASAAGTADQPGQAMGQWAEMTQILGMAMAWAFFRGVQLDFTRPNKPTDNSHIESFNGRLRDGCLNVRISLKSDSRYTPYRTLVSLQVGQLNTPSPSPGCDRPSSDSRGCDAPPP